MPSLPLFDLGNPETKSMEISVQGSLGIGNDAVIQVTTKDVVIPSGPITRARAKRMN